MLYAGSYPFFPPFLHAKNKQLIINHLNFLCKIRFKSILCPACARKKCIIRLRDGDSENTGMMR